MSREDSSDNNASSCIKVLWEEGFFGEVHTLKEVLHRIKERWGHNLPAPDISKTLSKVSFLKRLGKRGSYKYIQKISPKNKRVEKIEEQLFSNDLTSKFGTPFKTEVADLHVNFGRSGTCTAFLLRKILEKAIILVFAKNGCSKKLEDKSGTGRLIGLEAMVNAAAREKIDGVPILTHATAERIKGIKFLGDVSAHNPVTNADMETILPQMPFIITAYKELAERL